MRSDQLTKKDGVLTLDLNFMGISGAIACYLIPHAGGAILIECGPGSTVTVLQEVIKNEGYSVKDISDVFLTHIHLDHAGAAGWLARQGARIHVHPVGAPHMLNPEKLLSSAERIYGELMGILWGEFLPVPENQLHILEDQEIVEINGLHIQALDTPGHARHHYAYLYRDICFSGDIAGVRLLGPRHLVVPMPPPEFQLEDWRNSVIKLRSQYDQGKFRRIAPTHFGIFEDAGWHLEQMERTLDEIDAWIDKVLPDDPSIEVLSQRFILWAQGRYHQAGLDDSLVEAYEAANPSWMSPYGIQRYWNKIRKPSRA